MPEPSVNLTVRLPRTLIGDWRRRLPPGSGAIPSDGAVRPPGPAAISHRRVARGLPGRRCPSLHQVRLRGIEPEGQGLISGRQPERLRPPSSTPLKHNNASQN
jgi:hypothetical protein